MRKYTVTDTLWIISDSMLESAKKNPPEFRVMEKFAQALYEESFAHKLPLENLIWLTGFLIEQIQLNLNAASTPINITRKDGD